MKLHKTLIAASAGVALFAAGAAHAAGVFTVNPTNADPLYTNLLNSFQSDYIAGNYQEVVTLTPTGLTTGIFDYSILWTGSEFRLGGAQVISGFNTPGASTGLANTYTLYATLQGTGTYSLTGPALTPNVTFMPALGGVLDLFADVGGIGSTAPLLGSNPFAIVTDNARHLLTGTVTAANGQLNNAGVGGDFGSFGVETTLSLVNPDGENFFTGPRPFFTASFEAGNFNGYWLGTFNNTVTTRTLGGGAQITFDNVVPEPSGIALFGLALCAAGFVGRRRVRT